MARFCENCGKTTEYSHIEPVDDNLQKTWGISDRMRKLFNVREGSICTHCGVNIRGQGLAKAIITSRFGYGAKSLREWVGLANEAGLNVCELNACHQLHETLKDLKNYTYAEYGTDDEQDIQKLTYADNNFDLVLHSETLEHVNEPGKAMDECRRVINDKGLVLFTTPVIWERRTRRRAVRTGTGIDHLIEPSYHGKQTDDYLVYYEYGRDIGSRLGAGLQYIDRRHQNYVFYSGKQKGSISHLKQLQLQVLEKTAKAKG